MMLRAVFAIPLLIGCGLVTGRFFSYQYGGTFAWNLSLFRNKFFWLGVFVGLIFLWSDFRYARNFTDA